MGIVGEAMGLLVIVRIVIKQYIHRFAQHVHLPIHKMYVDVKLNQ